MRVRQPGRARHVDRDRIRAGVDDPSFDEDGPLPLVYRQAKVLFACHQEVAHVETCLESDDVAAEQTLDDRVTHLTRKHLPILRRRPGDVDEVLDDRAAELFADELRHQVHLVVVHHDQGPAGQASGHLHHLARNLLVDLDVSVLPGAVDAPVDHRLVREVPEVVLDEPQHRVRDDRVVLLVLLRGRRCVMQPRRGPDQRRIPGGAVLLDQGALAFGSGAGHPVGRGDLGEGEQGGDHTAGSTGEPPFRSWFVRSPVGDHYGRRVGQRACDVAAQRSARPPPLDAVQERAFRFVHRDHHDGEGWRGDGDGAGGGGGGADGAGDGAADGDAEVDGEADAEALGDALVVGDEDGVGDALQAPGRNGSCGSPPQPILMPDGVGYQSRMVGGRLLMKRFMIVRPTFSP